MNVEIATEIIAKAADPETLELFKLFGQIWPCLVTGGGLTVAALVYRGWRKKTNNLGSNLGRTNWSRSDPSLFSGAGDTQSKFILNRPILDSPILDQMVSDYNISAAARGGRLVIPSSRVGKTLAEMGYNKAEIKRIEINLYGRADEE